MKGSNCLQEDSIYSSIKLSNICIDKKKIIHRQTSSSHDGVTVHWSSLSFHTSILWHFVLQTLCSLNSHDSNSIYSQFKTIGVLWLGSPFLRCIQKILSAVICGNIRTQSFVSFLQGSLTGMFDIYCLKQTLLSLAV